MKKIAANNAFSQFRRSQLPRPEQQLYTFGGGWFGRLGDALARCAAHLLTRATSEIQIDPVPPPLEKQQNSDISDLPKNCL